MFRRQADYCDTRSPLYAALCRRLARDPRVGAIAPDLRWDFPLRLLGGLHYLVLGGEASWDDVGRALDEHPGFLARFTTEPVQTNEVARAWALLPGLLWAAGPDCRPVELLELGASAGLLLHLDGYGYRYRAGRWGDGGRPLLRGDDRGGPPASLLARPLSIARRRGVDHRPVDTSTAEGVRLLEAFVWPDQSERRGRLREAVATAREQPVELVAGDYVDLLPQLLRDRGDALTVVMSSITTVYLDDDRYAGLVDALARAGADGPLAWLSFEGPRHDREFDGVLLELTTWPGGETRRLAQVDHHAAWMRWW